MGDGLGVDYAAGFLEWDEPPVHRNEYGTVFGEGTDYDDALYPGLFEPEIRIAGMHGPDSPLAAADTIGQPVDPSFMGVGGGTNNNVRSESGVTDVEDFDMLGRVEYVPSSLNYYAWNGEGPVGGRNVGDEVGDAVIFDHLDMQPDPYTVRDDIIGMV